jgi:D-alanine--poly(phosphoribitol) ligase subunit 1
MRSFDPIALFRASARTWPGHAALSVEGRSWTYDELDQWSDAIADALIRSGARHERVALVAHKNVASYVSILGILKAGCAYVPLAPNGPQARWQRMMGLCGSRFALGEDPHIPGLTTIDLPGPNTSAAASPSESHTEAYVLFTSGSTGGPKGVSVSRENVAAYLQHMLTTYDLNERDRFTQFFALTFDLSVHDLFVCWGAGGCSCVPTDDAPLRAATFVREERITAWFSVPSLAQLMHRMRSLKPAALPTIRYGFFCGEALSYETVQAFATAAPQSRLINLYGPTETTIAITAFEVDRSRMPEKGTVPLGVAFHGHTTTINDEELWLSGPQVSNGYVNAPEATANAFVNVDGSQRWYRTGDRVRADEQGELHYLGRLDDQVKIAGYRVEPSEVDHLLAPMLAGGRSITVTIEEAGAMRLVTFIDTPTDSAILLAQCRAFLPEHMVPTRIIHVKEWPLTPHGKTDRQRLVSIAEHG